MDYAVEHINYSHHKGHIGHVVEHLNLSLYEDHIYHEVGKTFHFIYKQRY